MAHLNYLEGRLRRNGVDPATLGMRGWLQLAYAEQIDMADGFVNRYEVIKELDERLAKSVAELLRDHLVRTGKAPPDREAWGRSPQAQRGQRAMMRMAGGPAPMRPRPEGAPS